ncbi:hypothetical protein BpHYR1_000994 [Brachionus plicatilis]|uniref:Uncharacterized protein n=1 Tax=Brachionus plicatilis TaxID=10195 RepID=A0A3M7TCG8_BRAPC|nr:hypothetical protein BpHYR1_000994 [Brachionus plicatilis]
MSSIDQYPCISAFNVVRELKVRKIRSWCLRQQQMIMRYNGVNVYVRYSSEKFEIVQNSCTVVAQTTCVDVEVNSNSETNKLKTLKKGAKLPLSRE